MSGPPTWVEVRVIVPIGWQELVADALQLGPFTSVAFGRPSLGSEEAPAGHDYVRTFVLERDDTPELRARLRAALAELAARAGAPELAGLVPVFKRLPPEDWATSWQRSWKPFRVGALCLVRPGVAPPSRPRDVRLVLEPGGAFGSGRHPTTRACLRALQARPVRGARVLDAGTGNGVLAVAAALLGARTALGFDLDPNALPYALELARANAVQQRCTFRCGGFELLADVREPFDVVLANIYSDVIQQHAADLFEQLRPGGWFAFSGCPVQRIEDTRRAVVASGLSIEEEHARGRWRTLIGTRPEAGTRP